MPGKSWRLPLYPLLIAAYFPLYMMASDQGMTDVVEVIRPAAICVLIALVLMVLLGAILRDVHRAALWVAMLVILMFGVKFIQRIISGASEGGVEHIPGLYLLGGMTAVAVLLGLFARPGPNMTRIANVIMAVMVAFPVMSLVQRELAVNAATVDAGTTLQADPGFQTAADAGIRPNIVHIVLDAYSRQDVLAELYGYDNTPFLDRLRELGFAVADRATSPYNQTLLVMDSVFTGTMLEGSERFGSAIELRDNLRAQLRHNPVMATVPPQVPDRCRRCPLRSGQDGFSRSAAERQ